MTVLVRPILLIYVEGEGGNDGVLEEGECWR